MSAIEAVSRKCSTLADGTLRITVEISPIHAQDAFKLFGMPDVPMVIARLTQEAAKQSAQDETIAADKLKGGQLAKLAGMWCDEPKFWNWLNQAGIGISIQNPTDAKHAIYEVCDINSRAELDNYQGAADAFHKYIREPYSNYLKSL